MIHDLVKIFSRELEQHIEEKTYDFWKLLKNLI